MPQNTDLYNRLLDRFFAVNEAVLWNPKAYWYGLEWQEGDPDFFNAILEFLKFYYGIVFKDSDDRKTAYSPADKFMSIAKYLIDKRMIIEDIEIEKVRNDPSIRKLKFVLNNGKSININENEQKYYFRAQKAERELAITKSDSYCLIRDSIFESIKNSIDFFDNDYKKSNPHSDLIDNKFLFYFLLAVMCFADVNSGVSNKSKELEVFVDSYLIINKNGKSQETRQDLAKHLVKVAKFFSSQFQKKANEQDLKTGRIYPDGSKTFDQMVGLRLHRVAQGPIIFDAFKNVINLIGLTNIQDCEILSKIVENKKLASDLKKKLSKPSAFPLAGRSYSSPVLRPA